MGTEEEGIRNLVIRHDVEIQHLKAINASMSTKVDEMHAAMLKGQGAWKLMVAQAGLVSGLTALIIKLWPFATSLPLPK